MTPEQLDAVMGCTPLFAKWSMDSRRQLTNRIRVCHSVGDKAWIRCAPIMQSRTGVREFVQGVDKPRAGEKVGTRTYYLRPDNTVEHVDEWN